jgi:hypothetical protein
MERPAQQAHHRLGSRSRIRAVALVGVHQGEKKAGPVGTSRR